MARLVNLGSLCIDHVYRVPNLTGSGETVSSTSHSVFPGGKGLNQSLAAARAGADVRHCGCVGADGSFLVDLLCDNGVNVDAVRVDAGAVSGHAMIQVNDRGENAIVIAGGTNRTLTSVDFDAAFADLGEADWLLLQHEINNLEAVLARAESAGVRVAFNVAPVDGRELDYDLSGVALLIVNEIEGAALARLPADTPSEQLLDALARALPSTTVVLTLGADGLEYAEPGGGRGSIPAFEVEVVDETAAGDAFIGYLMAGLLDGVGLTDALRHGSAAGALAVTVAGAASSIPHRAAVDTLLQRSG